MRILLVEDVQRIAEFILKGTGCCRPISETTPIDGNYS